METTKIKIYLEKNADCPPSGLFQSDIKSISFLNKLIAVIERSSTVVLGEGVRIIQGGLGSISGRLVTATSGTTAVVIENISLEDARKMADSFPGWVVLPKNK